MFVISGGTDGLGLGGEVNSIGQIADRKGEYRFVQPVNVVVCNHV